MNKFCTILIIWLSVPALFTHVSGQSCAIDRVPSSTSVPQGGGTTFTFAIVKGNGSCTPIFTVSHNWLTYTYSYGSPSSGYLQITAAANPGQPRTGYVYVDNKESLKITINQAGSAVPVSSVSVYPTTAFLSINETKSLTATVSPSNATNKTVTWSSNSPSIASVNSNTGVVTGISVGNAIITVRTIDGNRTATCAVTVSAQPKNFSWKANNGDFTTPAKDQVTQGPCFLFAALGVIEAKYKIIYGAAAPIDLSEAALHPSCALNYESIPNSFNYSKNTGIIDEACYPYSSSRYRGASTCTPCATPTLRVKITNHTCIDFSTTPAVQRADLLKNAIKLNGTVAVAFESPSLHGGAMHAYEIYGWNESAWLMKDSWPNAVSNNLSTTVDIPNIIAGNGAGYMACYVNGIASISGGSSFDGNPIEEDILQPRASLYPNPSKTEITIDLLPADGGLIEIYRLNGTLAFNGKVSSNKFDITQLPADTYFIRIADNGKTRILRFVKE